MENASKALLIAGAILIAIVLITFGVIILGQGSEIINNSSMSDTEMATFNAKFTSFEGKNVRGSKVNSLLQTVLQHNLSQEDNRKQVKVTAGNTDSPSLAVDAKNITKKADTGATYEVECIYNSTGSGLINEIKVTKK